jgi:hypothetical protein
LHGLGDAADKPGCVNTRQARNLSRLSAAARNARALRACRQMNSFGVVADWFDGAIRSFARFASSGRSCCLRISDISYGRRD